jgi:hypothetical protein
MLFLWQVYPCESISFLGAGDNSKHTRFWDQQRGEVEEGTQAGVHAEGGAIFPNHHYSMRSHTGNKINTIKEKRREE